MKKFPQKVAIIGVGLIGGSIAMGLKKRFGSKITILGSCSTPKRAQLAAKRSIIDIPLKSLKDLPKDVDLIILAAPILTNFQTLTQLPNNIPTIDIGGTKETICKHAEKLYLTSFIGTHPMAGREVNGFEHADPQLFQHKPWVICPTKNNKKTHVDAIVRFVQALGAKPILMSAKSHDEITTWASHMPLIVSSILVNITKKNNWNDVKKIASTGFRDTTRLASNDSLTKSEISITNRKHITDALVDLKEEIDTLTKQLHEHKDAEILKYFQRAKVTRDSWIKTLS